MVPRVKYTVDPRLSEPRLSEPRLSEPSTIRIEFQAQELYSFSITINNNAYMMLANSFRVNLFTIRSLARLDVLEI